MKKLFRMLLIVMIALSMMIPWAVSAEGVSYPGAYVMTLQGDDPLAMCELFILAEDGTVYYVNASFHEDGTEFSRMYAGTWTTNGSGIHIVYGENTQADATLRADGTLLLSLGYGYYIPYVKMPALSSSATPTPAPATIEEALQNGLTLSPGQYYVGMDFPAGRYQITVAADEIVATFEVWPDSSTTHGKTYWLGSYYGGTTANIMLDEGNVLVIDSDIVTIRPYQGLLN